MKLFGTMNIRGDGGSWLVAFISPRAWGHIFGGRQKPFMRCSFSVYEQLFVFPFVIVWRPNRTPASKRPA